MLTCGVSVLNLLVVLFALNKKYSYIFAVIHLLQTSLIIRLNIDLTKLLINECEGS